MIPSGPPSSELDKKTSDIGYNWRLPTVHLREIQSFLPNNTKVMQMEMQAIYWQERASSKRAKDKFHNCYSSPVHLKCTAPFPKKHATAAW